MTQHIRVLLAFSLAALLLPFTSTTRAATNELVTFGSVWKYLDNGSDQGTAWRASSFNDASWASGPAQLGYGDGDEATIVSYGPDLNNKYITTYFRRAFVVTNVVAYTNLGLQLLRDDAGVVYLNGTEVFRSPNLPAFPAAITSASLSLGLAAENTLDTADITGSHSLLVNGTNVLAVEIHQVTNTSSDISFDLQLTGVNTNAANILPTVTLTQPTNNASFNAPTNITLQAAAGDSDGSVTNVEFFRDGVKIGEDNTPPSPFTLNWTNALVGTFQLTARATDNTGASTVSAPVTVTFTGTAAATLIPYTAVWKYMDNGSDQGTAWRALGFIDNTWASGPAPLGYGEVTYNGTTILVTTTNSYGPDSANKYITTYYRHAFTVADPAAYTFLVFHFHRDDGAEVYLNGTEVARDGLPAGPISFNTLAQNAADDGGLVITNTASSSLLVAGVNVVAVEMHQTSGTSSDIFMELELLGNTGAILNAPPAVAITSPANGAVFTEPGNVSVTAAASDSDGTVSSVDFYVNGSKVSQDTTAPYTAGLAGLAAGNYALVAVATDNLGGASTSAVVNVSVQVSTAPTLTGKLPAPGTLNALSQIIVQFSEPVDGVDASDLLINGIAATGVTGSNTNTTYTFTFPQPAEGPVSVRFAPNPGIVDHESPPKPFDATAAEASWNYTLVDTVAPTLVKISPIPGSTLASLTDIHVTFSEPVAGVNATDLRMNGVGATSLSGSGDGPYMFHFKQPTNGTATTVNVGWTNNHGIHDLSAAANSFAGGSWTYTLNTNVVETNIVINEIMYHPYHDRAAYVPEPVGEEYIELFNRGTTAVNLTGWRLKGGVDLILSNVTLNAGAYLVATPSVQSFTNRYGTTNGTIVGSWSGRLSDTDDDLVLEDALGQNLNHVHYSDQGDWAMRRILPDSVSGLPSWEWTTPADGGSSSMELINPRQANQSGQNWGASVAGGTPGRVNSLFSTNVAPLILEVSHSPVIPGPADPVTITARLLDEQTTGSTATLYWRVSVTNNPNAFATTNMLDDGLHGDGLAGDGVFGAVLPAQPIGTVVEFYVSARDSGNRVRTWPAPTDGVGTQGANALYQVDSETYTGPQPIYRLIMTPDEDLRLKQLNASNPRSDARMNGTFISIDGVETQVRYEVSIRHRGAGSRGDEPPNLRLNVPTDHRWKGVADLNLNTQNTHSQMAGSVLSRKAGLTSEEAIAVQVRVNGVNYAYAGQAPNGNYQFGSYIHLEARDSDWAANHFPLDPKGNLYTCTRPNVGLTPINPPTSANLNSAGYTKDSNQNDEDYTDIASLLNVINNTPDADFPSAVRGIMNVEVYLRYIAVLSLLGYGETAIGSDGAPDDYTLYRGFKDTRFFFVPHDHDTDLGEGDSSRQPPTDSIFRAADGNAAMNRLLRNPDFVPLYYKELKHQLETTFTPAIVARTLDESYLNFPVAAATVTAMKTWFTNRFANVWAQIPSNLVINPPALAQQSGYYRTTSSSVVLSGQANVIDTRFVKVNGQFASWTAWQGAWSANVALQPGINRIVVQSTDAGGLVLQETTLDIWYDDGTTTSVAGALSGSQVWTAANGPYVVTSALSVPSGTSLTIQPGTTVYVAAGASITVSGTGQLLAVGTVGQHIRFTRTPGAAGSWGSLDFISATPESRLAYVDFEFCGGTTIGGHNAQVHVNNSLVFFDHLTFPPTPVIEYISFDGSSFIVQNSVFPTYPGTTGPEMLHGVSGIPAGGYGIIRDNYFGHTWGFNDTIDFTGGNRPGAILQILNNVFDGATDDHLDLDSTDAWIEGNIFLHAHRDATRTDDVRDTASAISGGVDFAGQYSEWTIINNLFYDVDHATLNKGGGRFIFINNTLVHVAKEYGGGLVADIAAFDWTDDGIALPDPTVGAGAYVAGNILWDVPQLMSNYNPTNHTVILNNNLLPLPWTGPGSNNVVANPGLNLGLIANITNADWRTIKAAFIPQPGSPAIGSGLGGLDKGGLNPPGIRIAGEPPATTPLTTATLTVFPGGTFNWGSVVPPYAWGYEQYRWKLDGGPWSAETSITTSPIITLSNLANGAHTVYVVGRNDAGYEQDDPLVYPPTAGIAGKPTASRTWIVNAALPALRLNEVLARNDTAVPFGSKFPDLIELFNPGSTAVSLAGLALTDTADNPFKFVFPAGATLGAGQYLTVFADSDSTPAGYHTGFSLQQDGDELFLTAADGRILDSVVFGLQVPDFSIGRTPDGSWALCRPTFGAANVVQATGNTRLLKINEWLTSGQTPYADDFIELFNPDPTPVSLGELFLTDNPINAPALHDIAPLSFIAGGGYAVFIADGNEDAGANHVNFKLRSEEGMIALMTARAEVIDQVIYGPQRTDVSMGRQPNGSSTFGFFSPPNPGAPNPGAGGPNVSVVINEVLALNSHKREADGTTPDWVEFYNATAGAVDMGDMSLTDDPLQPRRYVFPPGSVIASHGFRVIRCDADIPAGSTNSGFGLKSTGQAVYLFDKLANGGGELSAVSFGVQAADFSIGRVPNGSGNWVLCIESIGAGNSAVVTGNPASLKVNEWMANPDGGNDWFEIYNPNAQPVALGSLYLSDSLGSAASRQKHLIAPLSFIGVGGWAYQRFEADGNVGSGPHHVSFKLDGTLGEEIGISSTAGSLLDGIAFGPQTLGVSQGRLPDGTANIVSFPGTGSPGDPNYVLLGNVAVNEVLTHAALPLEQAIELRNLTGTPVPIGGWFISNAKHDLEKFLIPDGTILPANGFKVFYQYQFNDTSNNPAYAFSLNAGKSDEVYLGQTDSGGALTGYRAQATFGAAEQGVSFGRYVTSVGGVEFTAMHNRTLGADSPDTIDQFRLGGGATNAYPRVGPVVISEIMYHPPDLGGTNDNVIDEFIELYNASALPVPLYHPSFPSNVWQLKSAVTFSFPLNTTIPAGGYVLIVSFDPANLTLLDAFRSKYSVAAGTPIFGPYAGKLNNSSDSLELRKPDAPLPGPGPDTGFVPSILVDRVNYTDTAPWPAGADGTGLSLQRVATDEYGNDPANWTAAAPTPGPQGGSADVDGDGMDDAWELANFGTLSRDGKGDFDGDGMTDLAEFQAGTDPTLSSSVLRLSVVTSAPVMLGFNAVLNRTYTVEYKNSLGDATWTLLQTVPAGPARAVQVPDGAPSAGSRFYRVRTP